MFLNIVLILCIYFFKLSYVYIFVYLSLIYFISGFRYGKNGSMKSFFITLDTNLIYRNTVLSEKLKFLSEMFITCVLMCIPSSILILIYTLIYGSISNIGISLKLIPVFFILLSSLVFKLIGEICGSLVWRNYQ